MSRFDKTMQLAQLVNLSLWYLCSGYLRKEGTRHFNCATFRLPWVRSLECLSKNFFLFFDANSLDRQHSERAHGTHKVTLVMSLQHS